MYDHALKTQPRLPFEQYQKPKPVKAFSDKQQKPAFPVFPPGIS